MVRKPMALPVASTANNIQLCEKIINELNQAEAEVLGSIENPESAWPFLSELRQLKRETQQDLAGLSSDSPLRQDPPVAPASQPVRRVMTRTGLEWLVFNGGQVR